MRRDARGLRALVVSGLALLGCGGTDSSGAPTPTSAPAAIGTSTAGVPTVSGDPPAALFAGYRSEVYADPSHWICRPDIVNDICDANLDATIVEADGTTRVEPAAAGTDAPIDCFYVYPTISGDSGSNSDLEPSETAEGFAVLNQAARLRSVCRVFAPVYRQTPVAALGARLRGEDNDGTSAEVAYGDVEDAWKHYLANDNGGRGVVLIGHSQGSSMLSLLLQQQIDPNADQRARVVAAYLAGWSLAVPEGADVGGDLANMPLCRAADQIGCVVTWSSYRSTAPPPPAGFFGRPRQGGGVAGCTNPAALAGGSAELHSYLTNGVAPATLGVGANGPRWLDPQPDAITTPFVQLPGLVTGECVERDGFNYLEVTVHGDPSTPRVDDIDGDLTPAWGLHLQDINLVMGDVVALVGSQAEAYASTH